MSGPTNFIAPRHVASKMGKIHTKFMVPITGYPRLFISMQPMNTNWQMWQPHNAAAPRLHPKESQLKLSLETRNCGDVIIVHCQGRIVYRDEAAALSRVVSEVLQHAGKLVLDLSGVHSIDSAGIGELAALHLRAQEQKVSFKCSGANTTVRTLLDLTNLDTVLDVYPSLEAALEALREQHACADC